MGRKRAAIAAALAALLNLGSASCQKNRPNYQPEIWAGTSAIGGVRRTQVEPAQELSCLSPAFDSHLSMTYDTMGCIIQTYILNCAKFKEPVVNCQPVDRAAVDAALGIK